MKRRLLPLTAAAVLVVYAALPAAAHEPAQQPAVVIDTDVGLDDVVALAMALQSPHLDVHAIVACAGVADRAHGVETLERLLDVFNRGDVRLYAAAPSQQRPAPPFRGVAQQAVRRALPQPVAKVRQPFAPEAYVAGDQRTTVVVLGPLTNLAAALAAQPDLKTRIAQIILAGQPDAAQNWNLRYDPAAWDVVRTSGLPLKFVTRGADLSKPATWNQQPLRIGQGTSLAEDFVTRLLADEPVRRHYLGQFGFCDELAVVYLTDPVLFAGPAVGGVWTSREPAAVLAELAHAISYGRQHKERVAFVDGPLPDEILQDDLRQRKARILANNGADEWFAQLMMNELHDHLGAYSVVGVKMGLRAAELLNAPPHSMQVTSHCAPAPPVSCLNDGVIVATGSTPGRGLFQHVPGPAGSACVAFEYNGRRLTLALKDEYRQRIRARIMSLLERHQLEDREYWVGVRRLGLEIWENWHRRELFEAVDAPGAASE